MKNTKEPSQQHEYAKQVKEQLVSKGIRVVLDDRNEKVGYKIREAQLEKVPYMLVLGEKEVEANTVAIRSRAEGDIGTMSVGDFREILVKEIENKTK